MKLKLSVLFLIMTNLAGHAQDIDSMNVLDNNGKLKEIGVTEDGKIKNRS